MSRPDSPADVLDAVSPDVARLNPQVFGKVSLPRKEQGEQCKVVVGEANRGQRGKPSAKINQSEESFQWQVIDLLHAYGYKVAHFRTVRVQRRNGQVYYATPVQADGEGFPDIIAVGRGRVLAIEVKSDKGQTSVAQDEWLTAFSLTDVKSYVFKPKDWDKILEVLK